MQWKEKRGLSFALVTLVYIIASVIGVFVYQILPYGIWLNLLIADIVATVAVFLASVICGNASVYDPYWSVQPIVIVVAFAFGYGLHVSGVFAIAVVCLWGVRLTANWAYTFHGLHAQDWRYTMLKQRSGKWYPFVNFFGIHLVPTLIVYACTMPAVAVIVQAPHMRPLAVLGVVLSVLAFTMQGIADIQMHKFRRSGVGGFIRTGLWKYSRHPNYLGEILMWWGVALFGVALLPKAWYLLAGAVGNTLLFLGISIPMADKRQARKAGFAEYKAQTRMLLPVYKRCAPKNIAQ